MADTIDMDKLARSVLNELLTGRSLKAVSGTPTTTYGHGPNGLFSAPGVDPDIFNVMQLPTVGLEAMLPVYPTNYVNPVYDIVTGQTATTGSEPTTSCGDFPEAGLTSLCEFQTVMDRKGRSTRVFDVTRVGQVTNRGELFDYNLIGDPLAGNVADQNSPTFGDTSGNMSLNSEIAKAMRELKVAYVRDFAQDLYTGNPANNQGTGRLYYKGLDLLVNTGYADYVTTTACPAADSLVYDWASADLATGTNGSDFIRRLVAIYRQQNVIADEAGLSPVKFVFAMPRSLFWYLAEIWPCAYYTSRCPLPTGATQFVDSVDQTEMRDDMRRNSYLLIDGEKVPVVQDVAIRPTALTGADAGSFTGPVYLLPLTVRGGKAVLYKQYFNFNGRGAAMDFLRGLGGNIINNFATTDNGRFLWLFEPPNTYCVQMQVISRETLVLRTPYLAARVMNVRWTPLTSSQPRSPFVGDATYVNGGKTSR